MLYLQTEKYKEPTHSFLNIRFPRHNPDSEIEVKLLRGVWVFVSVEFVFICAWICLCCFWALSLNASGSWTGTLYI